VNKDCYRIQNNEFMAEGKLIITPKTKIGDLLDAFPHLENILMDLSPAFAKLKNPVLRKTVARVASLQQAAIVGGLKVDELVNRLRLEAGQGEFVATDESGQPVQATPPAWFSEDRIIQWLDAIPMINAGESPMAEILSLAKKLNPGEILELKTPFVPAPIIDMLKDRGFSVYSLHNGEIVLNYITRE
jgi:hypothetical protein